MPKFRPPLELLDELFDGPKGVTTGHLEEDSLREFLPDADENDVPAEVTDVVNETDEPRWWRKLLLLLAELQLELELVDPLLDPLPAVPLVLPLECDLLLPSVKLKFVDVQLRGYNSELLELLL